MKYLPTIGIECHVQLKTKTKLFSAVTNDARGAAPNTTISPICLGLPGTLPVLNERAVELGVKAGLALNAEIADWMKFDRKHYFYPDLPKGYQITQYDEPIIRNGHVDVSVAEARSKSPHFAKATRGRPAYPVGRQEANGDAIFRVRIERAHLEEDAGKSTHPDGVSYSLVDLNRAGTPLLEIVSQPDMHSPEEARAYAHELYLLMKYADVSDVDLYHGNMRFDCNVSVALADSDQLGTRSETKNLNSFRAVEKAVAYEIERQIELLEKGEKIVQETRGWDETKQKTFSQRTKEDAHDYRYFPDPDIPPIKIDKDLQEKVTGEMPMLPPEIRKILLEKGAKSQQIETLLERPEFIGRALAVKQDNVAKVTNWLAVDVAPTVSEPGFDWSSLVLSPARLDQLADLVAAGQLNSTAAKDILLQLVSQDFEPESYAVEHGLVQMSGSSEMESIVDAVLLANPGAVEDIKKGEQKAIGFLVGQIMKESKGQANPQLVKDLIVKRLA